MFKDGFGLKKFHYVLKLIVEFLEQNPEELVTIFLENYIVDVKKMQAVFREVQGFKELVFNPYAANVKEKGWPRIKDMIAANQRILIVDDEQRGEF